MVISPTTGAIEQHGTFADVTSRLPALAKGGISSVILMGAMERDNGWYEREPDASPAATPSQRALQLRTSTTSTSNTGAPSPSDEHVEDFSFFARALTLRDDGEQNEPLAGHRAYAMRPDANPLAVVDRITPNRMLGGASGLLSLVRKAEEEGVGIVLQLDASVRTRSLPLTHLRARVLFAACPSAPPPSLLPPSTRPFPC